MELDLWFFLNGCLEEMNPVEMTEAGIWYEVLMKLLDQTNTSCRMAGRRDRRWEPELSAGLKLVSFFRKLSSRRKSSESKQQILSQKHLNQEIGNRVSGKNEISTGDKTEHAKTVIKVAVVNAKPQSSEIKIFSFCHFK